MTISRYGEGYVMMWGYFNSHPHIIPNISDFLLYV